MGSRNFLRRHSAAPGKGKWAEVNRFFRRIEKEAARHREGPVKGEIDAGRRFNESPESRAAVARMQIVERLEGTKGLAEKAREQTVSPRALAGRYFDYFATASEASGLRELAARLRKTGVSGKPFDEAAFWQKALRLYLENNRVPSEPEMR